MSGGRSKAYSYADAGVDIAAGDAFVEALKPAAASTRRPGADASLGGFGALFDLKAAGFSDPLLVASTDGVGTKLKIAFETGRHETIGIDLVAMCANDVLVQGAEPLFFLDYFATGRLDPATATRVVEGIAEGCRQAGCALVGGETAEMPGMYSAGEYDLAGFIVGAVERSGLITGERVAPGDRLLGIASSGPHSNGYSLIRMLVGDLGLDYDAAAPFDDRTSLGEALLAPTRIYVESCLPLARTGRFKALAHITGGGLVENLPRSLPRDTAAHLDAEAWPLPPVFAWLKREGGIAAAELARTFNCGIGIIVAVAADEADRIIRALEASGEIVWPVGEIRAHEGPAACLIEGGAGVWGEPAGFSVRSSEG